MNSQARVLVAFKFWISLSSQTLALNYTKCVGHPPINAKNSVID